MLQFILNTKHATLKEDLFLHPRTKIIATTKGIISNYLHILKVEKIKEEVYDFGVMRVDLIQFVPLKIIVQVYNCYYIEFLQNFI